MAEMKKTKRVQGKMRKVRIICSDPYATDNSSSEDEIMGVKCERKTKKMVTEVTLPFKSLSLSKVVEPETCCHSNSRVTAPTTSKNKASNKATKSPYRGVLQRKSGKWAAKIHDPFSKTKIWLGTYDNAEDASRAYEERRLQYQKMLQLATSEKSITSSSAVELEDCAYSPRSPSSVLDVETCASNNCSNDVQDGRVDNHNSSLGVGEVPVPHDLGFVQEMSFDAGFESKRFLAEVDYMLLDDVGKLFSDFGSIDDIHIGGFDGNEPSSLPDSDFEDLASEDLACWIDEASNIQCL